NQITSPGPIASIGPPQRWTRPRPAVTIRVWPSGWLCHAVRAPGSKVTLAPTARAGSGASNRGSMRTAPVKYSDGALPEGCEQLLLMSMCCIPPPCLLKQRGMCSVQGMGLLKITFRVTGNTTARSCLKTGSYFLTTQIIDALEHRVVE